MTDRRDQRAQSPAGAWEQLLRLESSWGSGAAAPDVTGGGGHHAASRRRATRQAAFRPRASAQSRAIGTVLVAGALSVALVLGFAVMTQQVRARENTPAVPLTTDTAQQPVADAGGSPSPSAQGRRASRTRVGVFRGSSPAQVQAFGDWLGRDVSVVVDFSQRDTWADIAAPQYLLDVWDGQPYRLVLSTALLPKNQRAQMAAGARGEYDHYYRQLAELLVRCGQERAVIRLGWEFNLRSSLWFTDDPQEFIAYWRNVVRAMRSVPGQRFEFDWNPNVGDTPFDAVEYYPGDDYVDFIGADIYDVSWTMYPFPKGCDPMCVQQRRETVWAHLSGGRRGLQFWARFAQQRGKPLTIPEWGLWRRPDGHGGGDNVYFVQQMHRFVSDPANNVAYQAYFEWDGSSGEHRVMTSMPAAGTVFRKLFGSR